MRRCSLSRSGPGGAAAFLRSAAGCCTPRPVPCGWAEVLLLPPAPRNHPLDFSLAPLSLPPPSPSRPRPPPPLPMPPPEVLSPTTHCRKQAPARFRGRAATSHPPHSSTLLGHTGKSDRHRRFIDPAHPPENAGAKAAPSHPVSHDRAPRWQAFAAGARVGSVCSGSPERRTARSSQAWFFTMPSKLSVPRRRTPSEPLDSPPCALQVSLLPARPSRRNNNPDLNLGSSTSPGRWPKLCSNLEIQKLILSEIGTS